MPDIIPGQTLPFGDMGPCEIVWDYDGVDPIYLGKFLGGLKLSMTTSVEKILEDQSGIAAVNAIYTGSEITLTIPLTRLTIEQIATVLRAGVLDDEQVVPIKNQVGCDLYDEAKIMMIKPICGNQVSEDSAEWIRLFRVAIVPGFELVFDVSTQRTLPTTFMVFVSQEDGEEGLFGTLGVESGALELKYAD